MNVQERPQAGYSLPEMLTVLAIIGMLALVMVPNFITFYQSNKVKSSMRTFTSDIRGIRQYAITQGRQTLLTFRTGTGQRTYDYWVGNRPFASTQWTRLTGPGQTRSTRRLDDVIYFPATTFTDTLDCSSGTNCTAGTDGLIDVIFLPDGTVLIPSGPSASITIKTDMRVPKNQYVVAISPSGRVVAQ